MSIRIFLAICCISGIVCAANAEDEFPADLAKRGEQTYLINCSRCHGIGLVNPVGYTFDLRQFPADERDRFFNSVMKGKGNMPAWGDLLKEDQVQALWAYVQTQQKKPK